MTTWTDNLEVPHLDQNVAQPEIPENVAKDIFDTIFAGMYTTDFPSDADYIYVYVADPTLAQPWHNYVQKFTDVAFPLLATRTVTFPANKRPYLLFNDTDQELNFKISGSGTSILLAVGETVYAYSDSIDLIKFDFGTISTLLGLSDTPGTYDNTKLLRSTVSGTEWYDIVTDLAAKLAHTGGTITNIGVTAQTVTSGATPAFDLSSGNIVSYTNTEIATITFTTTHTNTSFKLALTNGSAFTLDWDTNQTIVWEGGTPPTLQSAGKDLLEFVKIGTVWIGNLLVSNYS